MPCGNKTLKFYDVRKKRSFSTSEYGIVEKKGRKLAVATSKAGNSCYRILGK